MVRLLLCIFLSVSFSLSSQELPEQYFSDAISKNIRSYKKKMKSAYRVQDFERADFLFDSLVKHVINGSYFDDFTVKKINGRKLTFSKFKKPVFLMTYASWCTPGSGEIPALNEIAKKYKDEIDFVVLFWDKRKEVKKIARDYDRNVTILYVDELDNKNCHIIKTLKHSLGFPTSFFLDQNKKIVDVRRGVLHHYSEAYAVSYSLNYESFRNGISLLLNLDSKEDVLANSGK
ncbi:MAG: TlpA disulfide reductase family protein [Flavobacteriaceae bacterium]